MELPQLDVARVARLHCAIAGGSRAGARDRELAAWLAAAAPALPAQFRAAAAFQARRAVRAVTEDKAGGVLFACAGLPCGAPPHLPALAASPSARFAYAASDPQARLTVRALLAGDRVRVTGESARDPEALMGSEAVAWLGSPLQVQVPLAAHFLPAAGARAITAAIGEALPAGSSLVLSLWSPSPGEAGQRFLAMLSAAAGAQAHGHSPEDVTGWLKDAGLEPHPHGVTDVRAWPARWPEDAGLARSSPGRVIGAVGLKA
jgi:hypothetical protein